MKELRAATEINEVATEKLTDLEGRLDAGLRLYVMLTSADVGAAPRAVLRVALDELTEQLASAEGQLREATYEMSVVEEHQARLNRALGNVATLRAVARHAVLHVREVLRAKRTRLLGELFGSRHAYERLKAVRAARVAVGSAASYGEAMLATSARAARADRRKGLLDPRGLVGCSATDPGSLDQVESRQAVG